MNGPRAGLERSPGTDLDGSLAQVLRRFSVTDLERTSDGPGKVLGHRSRSVAETVETPTNFRTDYSLNVIDGIAGRPRSRVPSILVFELWTRILPTGPNCGRGVLCVFVRSF